MNELNSIKRETNREDSLLQEAREADYSEELLDKKASLESEFNSIAATVLLQKSEQVERIEGQLESMISRQMAKIQSMQNGKPNFFSLPRTKSLWASQIQQAQARLLILEDRLEDIQEIKNGMAMSGSSKLQELAIQKVRKENKELAADFDNIQVAVRVHKLHEKQRLEREKQAQSRAQSLHLSRSIER